MNKKPLILVTNDDGITAPGIRTLIDVMAEIGDVVVVAPDSPQSGMGHAITVNNTLYLDKISKDGADNYRIQLLGNACRLCKTSCT
jgi:5'-nucleotidase